MGHNIYLYGWDIALMRTDTVSLKTSEFIKRNYNRIKNTIDHIVIEIKRYGSGIRNLNNDIKTAAGYGIRDSKKKYSKDKPWEKAKIRQVKKDVIKFVPFSFFILIPGAEILLPPFLVVFPEAVPSQFLSN